MHNKKLKSNLKSLEFIETLIKYEIKNGCGEYTDRYQNELDNAHAVIKDYIESIELVLA